MRKNNIDGWLEVFGEQANYTENEFNIVKAFVLILKEIKSLKTAVVSVGVKIPAEPTDSISTQPVVIDPVPVTDPIALVVASAAVDVKALHSVIPKTT